MNTEVKCKEIPERKLKSINEPKSKFVMVSIQEKSEQLKELKMVEKFFTVGASYSVLSSTKAPIESGYNRQPF